MNIDVNNGLDTQKLRELEQFKSLFGELPVSDDLSQVLIQKEEEISKFRAKLELQQKSEARLFQELDTLGKAWQKLEEQNSRKVLNLVEKEDHIQKLLQEVDYTDARKQN
jgi:septal ring factor EnvC (AmiA/AmiB activator)